MTVLVVPILAQALTFGVGDRTEVREVLARDGNTAQAESRAVVGMGVSGRRWSLSLGYSPSMTVEPLESSPRTVTLLHSIFESASTSWSRQRTTFTLSEAVDISRRNFLLEAYSAAAPTSAPATAPGANPDGGAASPGAPADPEPSATPTTTTPEANPASGDSLWYATANAGASVSHAISRRLSFGSSLGYSANGALVRRDRELYPITHGPNAGLTLGERLSRRDALETALSALMRFNTRGDRGFGVTLSESYTHQFTARTRGTLGAGVAYFESQLRDEAPTRGIHPSVAASLESSTRLQRGTLTMRAGASYAPAFDRSTLRTDQRVALDGALGWTRDAFSVIAVTSTALSLDPDRPGGISYVAGGITAAYQLGLGFQAEAGARTAWQTYSGEERIPPSAVIFAALSWAAAVGPL